MTFIEIVALFLLNAIPIIIVVIPYFFIRKKFAGKVYFRVMLGIMVFYLIYWVLPIIFQLGTAPIELELHPGEEGNLALGIGYIITHIGSLFIIKYRAFPSYFKYSSYDRNSVTVEKIAFSKWRSSILIFLVLKLFGM